MELVVGCYWSGSWLFFPSIIFSTKMATAGKIATMLARIIGLALSMMPYDSQNKIPNELVTYINSEILFTSRVFIMRMACGNMAVVVSMAATVPMASIMILF